MQKEKIQRSKILCNTELHWKLSLYIQIHIKHHDKVSGTLFNQKYRKLRDRQKISCKRCLFKNNKSP